MYNGYLVVYAVISVYLYKNTLVYINFWVTYHSLQREIHLMCVSEFGTRFMRKGVTISMFEKIAKLFQGNLQMLLSQ